jgi:hypothetical protein
VTVADAGAPANTTFVAVADVSGTVDGLSADAVAHHAVTNVPEVAGIPSAVADIPNLLLLSSIMLLMTFLRLLLALASVPDVTVIPICISYACTPGVASVSVVSVVT